MSGGRYLLLTGRTVLDVQTLAIYPITYPVDVNTSGSFPQLAGYTVSNVEAVGLSPHNTQLVLVGSRPRATNDQQLEYALVVVDFIRDRAYVLPFDQTDARFVSMWTVPPGWLTTYFDWTTDPDGQEVLSLHKFSRLPYWQGRLELEPNTDQPKQYVLTPVRPGLTTRFMDVVRQQHPATELITHSSEQLTTTEFTINATKLTLYYDSIDKTLTLTGDDKPLIKTLGDAFDRELAKGRFQSDFGTFSPD